MQRHGSDAAVPGRGATSADLPAGPNGPYTRGSLFAGGGATSSSSTSGGGGSSGTSGGESSESATISYGARTADEVRQLVADIVAAIAMNEIGGASHAVASRLHTAAGVAASYASATQMVASHATTVLRASPDVMAEHGLDTSELAEANRIMLAAQRIWDAIVEGGHDASSVTPADLALTHFTAADLTRMTQFARFRQRLLGERHRFEHPSGSAAEVARALAAEMMTDENVIALGLTEADVRAYIHNGRMNRFREDRNAWNRVALQRTNESTPMDGAAPRSLDAAIRGAAEADGGWALSRSDFDRIVRSYLTAHPEASDEAVVRHAASHNGHSADYPDRIWRNFQRVRGGAE
jgi:hypothetical protein